MNYTLITSTGRVYTFFILAAAEAFQQAYGGTLIDSKIFAKNSVQQLSTVV